MHDRLYELPDDARRLIQSIEAFLAEAQPLMQGADVPPELIYTVREMTARYLPDTVAAFLAVPRSQRATSDEGRKTANDLLLEQLSVLYRSAQQTLTALAAHARGELAANARFLAERFDDRSTDVSPVHELPQAVPTSEALPAWFAQNEPAAKVVARIAAMFHAHLPALTRSRRGGVLGMGAIEAIEVTLPQGGGTAFRYALSAREGALETTVSKLVHGTVIKRVVCTPQEWLQSLYDDVAEHARRHQEMRAAFTSLFSR
jgi:hypothetical protein